MKAKLLALGAVFGAFVVSGPLQHVGVLPQTVVGDASKALIKAALDLTSEPAFGSCGGGLSHGGGKCDDHRDRRRSAGHRQRPAGNASPSDRGCHARIWLDRRGNQHLRHGDCDGPVGKPDDGAGDHVELEQRRRRQRAGVR